MARPVSFHRRARFAAHLGGSLQAADVHLALAKDVDLESGMTLNLVEVDQGLQEFRQHISDKEFQDLREFLSVARVFFGPWCQDRGAELRLFEAGEILSGERAQWSSADPTLVWKIETSRARFEQESRQWTGSLLLRKPWGAPALGEEGILQRTLAPGQDLCEKLGSLDPAAVEVHFQDALTGRTWRWDK